MKLLIKSIIIFTVLSVFSYLNIAMFNRDLNFNNWLGGGRFAYLFSNIIALISTVAYYTFPRD